MRCVVVVLPFVPVIPIMRSLVDGCPWILAATGPIARRTSATTI